MIGKKTIISTCCFQCGNEKAYFESDDLTFETLTFCRKCGYTEKYIIRDNEDTTKYVLKTFKKLYDKKKYKEALLYVGFNNDFLKEFTSYYMKEQIERMLKNPPRSPVFSYYKGKQYFKYKAIIKDGFGTYKYTDDNGYVIRGRFVNEKHRAWKIGEIQKHLSSYSENGEVEVYSCDKDEVVERLI